jgi:hypothetical protein
MDKHKQDNVTTLARLVVRGFGSGLTTYGVPGEDFRVLGLKHPVPAVLEALRKLVTHDVDVIHDVQADVYLFTRECQHTRVLERYSRHGPYSYRVDRACCRCGLNMGMVTRMGGESAKQRVVLAPSHVPLPLEEEYESGGYVDLGEEADGPPAGDAPAPHKDQGDGTEQGDSQAAGKPDGSDGDSDGDTDSEGEEGEGTGKGKGKQSGEGEGDEGEGDEGEGEGGQEDPLDAFVRVFLREWVAKTPDSSPVYRRVQVLQTQEVAK